MNAYSTKIVGIVNVTEDSFSDGGRHLAPPDAIAHAERLIEDGADVIELGPASSHPEAVAIASDEEVRRIEPVLDVLKTRGVPVSVDSWQPATQRYCIARGVEFLNDIEGFSHPGVHGELATASCRLIVMHSVQRRGPATRVETDPDAVAHGIESFFEERIRALAAAGVQRSRLVLDPGMGLFLGSNPEPSLRTLATIGRLRERFELPVLVSVSRKSFLRAVTGRKLAERGAATLAAEIWAAGQGVEFIRTHDVGALHDALSVLNAIGSQSSSSTRRNK